MSDRELLELAAKAAGMTVNKRAQADRDACGAGYIGLWIPEHSTCWNPLTDDGDALRLAVKLRIDFYISNMNGLSERTEENAVVCHAYNPSIPSSRLCLLHEPFGTDDTAATRRAIVRAAAEIGKALTATPTAPKG